MTPFTIDDIVDWQLGGAPPGVRQAIERDLALGESSVVREYIDWSSGRRRGPVPRLMREDWDAIPPETRAAWAALGEEPERAPARRGPDEIARGPVVPLRPFPLLRERLVRRMIALPGGVALLAGLAFGIWLGLTFCPGDGDPRYAGKGEPRDIGRDLRFYPPEECVRVGNSIAFEYSIENVGEEDALFSLRADSIRAFDESGRPYTDYDYGLGAAASYALRFQDIRIVPGERVPGHLTFRDAHPRTRLLTIHFNTRPEVGTFVDVPVVDGEPGGGR